jgi:small subunit ribosomal protein S8
MTDPIADMLTRIRNACAAKHQKVDVPLSKLKLEIVRLLRDEGYINNFKLTGESPKRMIRIYLRYGSKGEPVINHLARMSKPGCRRYAGSDEIPNILGGLGLCVISTSRGIMSGKQARKENIGGEVMCEIY